MSATGLPERIGRWSPEQRAQADQKRRAIRFLVESALVPVPLLLRLTGRNAHQDAMAVGWSGRPWLRAGGSFSVGYRYNDGPAWHPPHMADVRPIDPPHVSKDRVWAWLFANGCESVKALCGYRDGRISTRFVPSMAARGRGTNGWSLSALDRIHPDQTCGASQ